jgi:hypothetical protein
MFPYYDWHYKTYIMPAGDSTDPTPVVIRERVYNDPDPSTTWGVETEGINGLVIKRHQITTALGSDTSMLYAYMTSQTAGLVYTMIDVDCDTQVIVETPEHNDRNMARHIMSLWYEDTYLTETQVWDSHSQQWEANYDHTDLLVGKDAVFEHFEGYTYP